MTAKRAKTTLFASLIGTMLPPSGLNNAFASHPLGKNMSGGLKDAKYPIKAGNIPFLTAIGAGLLMVGGLDPASACSLSNHCYVQWHAQWHVWPGFTGDRQEYGVKSTVNTVEMSDDSSSNDFVAHSQWMVHHTGGWVEIGTIQGDFPGCPALAENTERSYWISWDGSIESNGNLMIEGGCVSAPSVSSATVELSDTDRDGDWVCKVGSTTISTGANGLGKGYVRIGGESTDADSTLDGDLSSLQCYDAAWQAWAHHGEHVIGAGLNIEECSASSTNVGDDPSCG